MKMKKTALALVVAAAASAGVVGCHDSKDRTQTYTTSIEVFDGYALGCTTTANGIAASEVGNGQYTLTTTSELAEGSVISSTGCTDADTGAQLPELKGVTQSGGAAVSPITTLIVAAAIAQGGDPANLSAAVIDSVTADIVANLGLGSYDPVNPATANYVDTVGTSETSQAQMQVALAISTLLVTVEKAAGTAAADNAFQSVATAIADASAPINLESTAAIQTLMTSAAALDSSVASAITAASNAVAEAVATIASASSVDEAAAMAQAVTDAIEEATSVADADVPTDDELEALPPIGVGVVTDPDTGATAGTGGTGA